MAANEPAKPSGEAASSSSKKAGKARSTTRSVRKTEARADLDARHERVTRPRRAMGPPLGSTASSRSVESKARRRQSDVPTTDPKDTKKSTRPRKRS
jgi:hypothetical protein